MEFDDITALLQSHYGDSTREVEPEHWMLEVSTGRQRSQLVHLLLKQREEDGHDFSRLVVDSPIGPVPKRYDFKQLLHRNAELDTGAICIEDFRNEDNELVSYLTLRVSHLVHTADEEEILEMIEATAQVADDLEREIFAKDLH